MFITISGYGMTGPYKDMPSHGVAYDTWAGLVNPGIDEEGFAYIPEHPSMGIHAGPLFGALGILAGVDPGPGHGRGLPHGDRPVRRRRGHGLVPQRDVEGVRAARVEVTGNKSDDYERRAPGTAGMRHGVRYQIYESKDGYVLFQASEREFWKNFCAGVDRMDLFERWPGARVADHAPGNRELQAELRTDLRCPHHGRVDRLRRRAQHADRPGEHAPDAGRRPAVPAPAAVPPPARRSAPSSCRRPIKLIGEDLPTPTRAPTAGRAHRRGAGRRCWAASPDRIAELRAAAPLG